MKGICSNWMANNLISKKKLTRDDITEQIQNLKIEDQPTDVLRTRRESKEERKKRQTKEKGREKKKKRVRTNKRPEKQKKRQKKKKETENRRKK